MMGIEWERGGGRESENEREREREWEEAWSRRMPESRVKCAGDDGEARTTKDRERGGKPVDWGQRCRSCTRWSQLSGLVAGVRRSRSERAVRARSDVEGKQNEERREGKGGYLWGWAKRRGAEGRRLP